jgi:hypothetical protein
MFVIWVYLRCQIIRCCRTGDYKQLATELGELVVAIVDFDWEVFAVDVLQIRSECHCSCLATVSADGSNQTVSRDEHVFHEHACDRNACQTTCVRACTGKYIGQLSDRGEFWDWEHVSSTGQPSDVYANSAIAHSCQEVAKAVEDSITVLVS